MPVLRWEAWLSFKFEFIDLEALFIDAAQKGGIGPAGLASEDLHVLDFTDFKNPKWHR